MADSGEKKNQETSFRKHSYLGDRERERSKEGRDSTYDDSSHLFPELRIS